MASSTNGRLGSMQSVEVSTRLGAAAVTSVLELIRQAETALGYRPVSDQFWIDFGRDASDDVIRIRLHESESAIPVIYAQVSSAAGVWSVESVVRPDRHDQLGEYMHRVLDATITAIGTRTLEQGRGEASNGEFRDVQLTWLVYAPTETHDAIAGAFGLEPTRRLYQMYRALPTGIAYTLKTRPFEPGRDDQAWLNVNQRAFAWNPEQGMWSLETLRSRIAEPWFDASGFLLHEREGRLAGFCWTKIHDNSSPALGEIYVIAVDPEFHGLGLGRALTLAGLDSLAARGIGTGMLFVDADNAAGVGLYRALGFTVGRTDCMYQGRVTTHRIVKGDGE